MKTELLGLYTFVQTNYCEYFYKRKLNKAKS